MRVQNLRTPLSSKQKNIAAMTRLIQLSRSKGYRGKPLDDRTPAGLARCIAAWLTFENHKCTLVGTTITIKFSDGPFEIQVEGSHKTCPAYPAAEWDGDTLKIWNLFSFADWLDENLLKSKNDE